MKITPLQRRKYIPEGNWGKKFALFCSREYRIRGSNHLSGFAVIFYPRSFRTHRVQHDPRISFVRILFALTEKAGKKVDAFTISVTDCDAMLEK